MARRPRQPDNQTKAGPRSGPRSGRDSGTGSGRKTGRAGGTSKPGVGVGGREPGTLPSRAEILAFIEGAQDNVGKREIAKAFGLKGPARVELKLLLADMAEDGELAGNRKELRRKGALPAVTVIEVTGRDSSGDLICRPTVWNDEDGERPGVLLLAHHPDAREDAGRIGIGDKVLARITELDEPDIEGCRFEAIALKRIAREKRRLLGIFREGSRGGGTIEPIDRKALRSWPVQKSDVGTAKDGDLVRFDLARKNRMANPQAQIVESLGNPEDQRQISLIAVHTHGIPDDFPESVLEESENLEPPDVKNRTDLTAIPLLTIDPPDARDHDDAVFAEPDSDPSNPGGIAILIAIADVAHYIRPGSHLDREAQLRGNSVYFPDRVVPMLPEKISNDLCSLRELEERPCLAVRIVFDAHGDKRSQTFMRAIMRSAAKLSYQEAQAAIDGNPSDKCIPLMETALRPLWKAYEILAAARERRQPLDLDLPERKIRLGEDGLVAGIETPERLTAHRLIEEFMIQANVAAAEALESKQARVVYRIHDAPSKEKLKSLRDFLETLDMKLPHAGAIKPGAFNKILERAKSLPVPELVNEVILRSQAQAEYNPDNIGHFGLNLKRYAHFTSPIRRYADLIVHRALVTALGLGKGGFLDDGEPMKLAAVCKAISDAERRAMAAERETVDRLIAHHLADHIGATFKARIAGVTRSGLFVRLADTGADGYVPISSLGDEFYHHVEEAHALVGQRSGLAFRLGDTVEVKLVEAIPSAGALRFEMLSEPSKADLSAVKPMPRGLGTRGSAPRKGGGYKGPKRGGGRKKR